MENLKIANVHTEDVHNKKALELYRNKACPHCGQPISVLEAVSLLWGDGYQQFVAIKAEQNKKVIIPLFDFNPQTMELLEPV